MDDKRFDEVIDINLKGTFLVTQIACQQLIQNGGGGSIVNISSISAKIGNIGQANYVASKAGVTGNDLMAFIHQFFKLNILRSISRQLT